MIRKFVSRMRSLVGAGARIETALERIDAMRGELRGLMLETATRADLDQMLSRASLKTAADIVRAQRGDAARAAGLRPAPRPSGDMEHAFEALRGLNPVLYEDWRRLFENGAAAYAQTVEGNCSHRTHEFALLFGSFVDLYGRGQFLDVGCGPYDAPSYLDSWDRGQLSGLEPLPLLVKPSFQVARGFGEFIPWDDGSFDTVVSGASLDHVLSLDKTLEEIQRVLKPKGRFLLWIVSIDGSPEFDEKADGYKLIDDFHVFHFDRKWLEPRLDRRFRNIETRVLREGWYHHVFYCLERL